MDPTVDPYVDPTIDPTIDPTVGPSTDPTLDPSTDPTNDPTIDPTAFPSMDPSIDPTLDPTVDPTSDPVLDPTLDPTSDPSSDPTFDPTMDPSFDPTIDPSLDPTSDPILDPALDPTWDPTSDPSSDPTVDPTLDPTFVPMDPCTWDISPGLSCNDNRNDVCDSASDGCTYDFCKQYAVDNGFNHFTFGLNQWCAMCLEDENGIMLDEGQVSMAETLFSRVCESEDESDSLTTECPTVEGYTVNCDQDCVGTEYGSVWTENVSLEECADSCSASEECTGFIYKKTYAKCKFYTEIISLTSMTDGRMCVSRN